MNFIQFASNGLSSHGNVDGLKSFNDSRASERLPRNSINKIPRTHCRRATISTKFYTTHSYVQ